LCCGVKCNGEQIIFHDVIGDSDGASRRHRPVYSDEQLLKLSSAAGDPGALHVFSRVPPLAAMMPRFGAFEAANTD
jgi:hypothetical protein